MHIHDRIISLALLGVIGNRMVADTMPWEWKIVSKRIDTVHESSSLTFAITDDHFGD